MRSLLGHLLGSAVWSAPAVDGTPLAVDTTPDGAQRDEEALKREEEEAFQSITEFLASDEEFVSAYLKARARISTETDRSSSGRQRRARRPPKLSATLRPHHA